jgi:2-polyprenyl-3-methyl-5-hydroxy-6-metoxy-1,4-benzoquinol methylase
MRCAPDLDDPAGAGRLSGATDTTSQGLASATDGRCSIIRAADGPGHLSIRLAGQHGLDVTGLDLDPTMIQCA